MKLWVVTARLTRTRRDRAELSSRRQKKMLAVVDDHDCERSEFEKDVPQTLDDSQPITYTTKPDKGSFLTRVALKWELHLSFEHGYVVIDNQLKTSKTNLFQKGRQMLTNCVQYFYKRLLKFVMVELFTVSRKFCSRVARKRHPSLGIFDA